MGAPGAANGDVAHRPVSLSAIEKCRHVKGGIVAAAAAFDRHRDDGILAAIVVEVEKMGAPCFIILMRAPVAFDDLPDRLGYGGIQRAVGVGVDSSGNKKNGAGKNCRLSNACCSTCARQRADRRHDLPFEAATGNQGWKSRDRPGAWHRPKNRAAVDARPPTRVRERVHAAPPWLNLGKIQGCGAFL